jgi:AcrR family transcriptional regulator
VFKKTDRRIQRTRQLLQDALMAMMLEKGYEAITVQDIIDRANVGRATFYAHFADKDTLLGSRLEDLRAMLSARQERALAAKGGRRERALGFSLAMLEHARSHQTLYSKIVGQASGALVLGRIRATIGDLVAVDLKTLGVRAGAQRDLAEQYIAGAFMSVLTWWLERGAKQAPEEVDQIFRRLAFEGGKLLDG